MDDVSNTTAGGADFLEVLTPQPVPYRDVAAERRDIWLALTDSPWDMGHSMYLCNVPANPSSPGLLTGQLSDGTSFQLTIEDWLYTDSTQLSDLAIQNDDSTHADEIIEYSFGISYATGEISTASGAQEIKFFFIEYRDDAASDLQAQIVPMFRVDSPRDVPSIGVNVGPASASGSAPNPVEQCWNDAEDDYEDDMTLAYLGLTSAVATSAALAVSPSFGVGQALAAVAATSAGIAAYVAAEKARDDYNEAIVECLEDHADFYEWHEGCQCWLYTVNDDV